jgi:hypothetical protein
MIDKNKKIHNILHSLKENKYTYLSILDDNGEEQFKIKVDVGHEDLKKILDTIFDHGFTVKKIKS